jgi:hypothetical protein
MQDSEQAREEIVELEARSEKLAGVIESCRKIVLVARAAIVIGAFLLVALALGVLRFDPLALLTGLTAILGGIVLFGSNSSTRDRATAELQAIEARRAELIGWIRPRVVGGTTVH